jgi:tRNA (adenine57-N1/adenine58-N1)-methyltransferase
MVIEKDSFVLVYRDRKYKWLIRPSETPKLHTHLGILDCEQLVGKDYGISVLTSLNDELRILRPTIEDIVMKFARGTQVIYPKDLAPIVFRCGVHSGSRVFEAGTGSGSATAALAYAAMPGGHVYTYDKNEEFQRIARRNLERFGLSEFVTLKLKDAKEGIDEREMDAALLDLGDPWELVGEVRRCLKPSGMLAAVTPTMNQAERLVEKMKEEGFIWIDTVEILMRHIEARVGMTRPSNAMIGHTAYLNFGRKTN